MATLKWGVLSTANIGLEQVIPALQRASNTDVVALASRGPKVHGFAEQLGIPHAHESYEELLANPEVEAVYIPLPNNLHKEWSIKAAQAGKHVLCEKPVTLTAEDLEEILTVCAEHGVQFMEAFMYQFHPQHARVREIIESGEIGEVQLFKSSHSFYFENREGDIRMNAEQGGGALWDVGCYSLHAMNLLLQKQPRSFTFQTIMDPQTAVDVSAFGIVELDGQVRAVIDCSFDMAPRNEYEIVGTKGSILVKYAFRPDIVSGNGQILVQTPTVTRTEQVAGDIYRLQVEYFTKAVQTGDSLAQQHEYSRKNTAALLAAYQSASSNTTVKVGVNHHD